MFRHTLTVLVAMILGALAEPGIPKNRRQNYNSNANLNEIYGGFGSGIGSDPSRDRGGSYGSSPKYETVLGPVVASGKERGGGLYDNSPKYESVLGPVVTRGKERGGGSYGSLPKYDSVLGPIIVSGKERAGLLGLMKYTTRGSGNGGGSGSENLAGGDNGYGRGSCEGLLESLFREDDEEATSRESTDDGGSSEDLFDYNSNYNIVFKDNSRRYLGYRPYVGNDKPRRGSNTNSNANSNILGSKYRRNYNWGPLRPTYGRLVNYDRNGRDYDRIDSDYDRVNQDYDKNSRLYDRNEEDYDRPSQDYGRGYRGTNVNSNSNQNLFGGRRSNINSNANSNQIHYGGYGQGRGNERFDRSPAYSGYGKAGPDFDDEEGQESYDGGYTTSRYPATGYTPRPSYAGYRDNDDTADDDEDYNPMQSDNVNSNVNSNVNIMSRRSNINSNANNNLFSRYKRSVENPPQASESLD